MAYKSGSDRTLEEIKKELKPFVDIYKDFKKLERYTKKREKERQIEKIHRQQQIEKWDKRLKAFSERIKSHKKIHACDKCGAEVSKDATKCSNCDAQFVEERVGTTFMCGHCHKLVKKDVRCSNCGAWFEDDKHMSNAKREILKTLNQNVRKDNFQKLAKEELYDEIKNITRIIKDNYKQVENFISTDKIELTERKIKAYKNKVDALNKKIDPIINKINQNINKEKALQEYNKIITIYTQLNTLHKEIIGGVQAKLSVVGEEIRSKNASIITTKKQSIKNNENNSYDEEPDSYIEDNNYEDDNDDIVYRELEDWQKKEVDNGNYDATAFEEEELEEDDYYYEDDKE